MYIHITIICTPPPAYLDSFKWTGQEFFRHFSCDHNWTGQLFQLKFLVIFGNVFSCVFQAIICTFGIIFNTFKVNNRTGYENYEIFMLFWPFFDVSITGQVSKFFSKNRYIWTDRGCNIIIIAVKLLIIFSQRQQLFVGKYISCLAKEHITEAMFLRITLKNLKEQKIKIETSNLVL